MDKAIRFKDIHLCNLNFSMIFFIVWILVLVVANIQLLKTSTEFLMCSSEQKTLWLDICPLRNDNGNWTLMAIGQSHMGKYQFQFSV